MSLGSGDTGFQYVGLAPAGRRRPLVGVHSPLRTQLSLSSVPGRPIGPPLVFTTVPFGTRTTVHLSSC